MKRVGKMMYPKQCKKSGETVCCVCGKRLTPAQAFYYVDGCNFAITNSAKPHCEECCAAKKGKGEYI